MTVTPKPNAVPDREQARSHSRHSYPGGRFPVGASLLAMSPRTSPGSDNPVIASAAKQSRACRGSRCEQRQMESPSLRNPTPRRSQRGLSILEFTLVVSIFSALIVFAANRVTELRVDLERAAVEHTLAGMRSALALEFAELIVQGKKERIREWAGGNPLELFDNRSVLEAEAGADPGPGDWHYDRARGEVVYRPAYPDALTGDADAVGRWRVTVLGEEQPGGLELVAVQPLPGIGRAQGGDNTNG